MFRDINDCFIVEGEEAQSLFPELNTSGLKILIDENQTFLYRFPKSWTDDQVWHALSFVNSVTSSHKLP